MRKTVILAATAIATFALPAFSQVGFIEESTYRSGGTYASYQAESAEQCSELCANEASCGSWSFLRHGSSRPVSRCELKIGIGRAEQDPNASSGISPRHEQLYYKPFPMPVALEGEDELAGGATASRPTRTTTTSRVVRSTSRTEQGNANSSRPPVMATVPGSTVQTNIGFPDEEYDGDDADLSDGEGPDARFNPPPPARPAQEAPRSSINRTD